jgi:4-amino-4-deoxy-L-arabinose transferase-like glycosyltransferase
LTDSRERTFDRLLLAGVALLYAVLALRRLDVPAPGYDEATYAPPALEILRLARGGTGRWPLTVMPYVGCPMSYVIAPFIRVWGLSVLTLRVPAAVTALAAVLILLSVVSEVFPRVPLWAPASACLLNSVFLISSRMGLYVDVSIHWLLLSLTLLCLWKWSLKRRPIMAFLAFFCAGFGIYSKIIFVWFALSAALVVGYASRGDARAPRARLAALCALGLLVGALPLLIYNVTSHWRTITVVWSHLTVPGDPAAASNLSLLANLATRWDQLRLLLGGRFLSQSGPARAAAGTATLLLAGAGFFLRREDKQRGALLSVAVFLAAFFLGSTLTVSSRSVEHLYPLLAPVLVLAGIALATLVPARLPLLAACALLAIPQWGHYDAYLRDAAQAADMRSPRALSSLSAYLSSTEIAHPVALDWGISYPLLVASGGKVDALEDDDLSLLRPGSEAICFWRPAKPSEVVRGCGRLLSDKAFVVGEIRKFPEPAEEPVYAAIRVRDVR